MYGATFRRLTEAVEDLTWRDLLLVDLRSEAYSRWYSQVSVSAKCAAYTIPGRTAECCVQSGSINLHDLHLAVLAGNDVPLDAVELMQITGWSKGLIRYSQTIPLIRGGINVKALQWHEIDRFTIDGFGRTVAIMNMTYSRIDARD